MVLVRKSAVGWAVVLVSVLLARPVLAAGFPDRPLTLLEPYPAGSISDIGARVLARELSAELDQPVRVVDATGGTTGVAASKLQLERPDGYTLFWDVVADLAYVIASKELPYTAKDFAGIAMLGGEASALIARTDDKRLATLDDALTYATGHPGALAIATGGIGILKKAFEDLQRVTHIKAKFIPYAGGSEEIAALLGGHVDLAITAPSNVAGNDKLRVIAVLTSAKTYAALPDVPTIGSKGYAMNAPLLRGLFVRSGTPEAVVNILANATQKALHSPSWHQFTKRFSQIETPGGPDAANADLQRQVADWKSYLRNSQ